jgi:hypothetical protein
MEILKDVNSIGELESISENVSWQDFERLVSEIFEAHGYCVDVNTVHTKKSEEILKRAQYDIIARRSGRVIVADCKHWNCKRYKISALKNAVRDHIKRCEFLREKTGDEVKPIIVSLFQEDIRFHENVPIVPVTSLNDFLLNYF